MDPIDERFEEIVRRVRTDPSTLEALGEELSKLTSPRPRSGPVPDGWYVIRVELLSGGGQHLAAPPGRDLLVSPNHTFRQLAELINTSFARWDLGHLYAFRMPDGSEIGIPSEDEEVRNAARSKIAGHEVGEVFEFEFDFGDSWLPPVHRPRGRCRPRRRGRNQAEGAGGDLGLGHDPRPVRADDAGSVRAPALVPPLRRTGRPGSAGSFSLTSACTLRAFRGFIHPT
jgi:hypothetical protein